MIGPSRPDSRPASAEAGPSALGPSLPPHLQKAANSSSNASENADEDEDDDDDYTPALPPSMNERKPAQQGPALPPHLAKAASRDESESDSDSDDDDVGPLPPPSAGAGHQLSAAEEFRLREKQKQDVEAEQARLANGKPRREDWMLAPPTGFDIVSSTDPTKIKSKGFSQNTRRGGAAGDKASDEGRSLWTERPEERAKRLDDEVMGKRKRVENAPKQESDADKRARLARQAHNEEMQSRVEAYNTAASRSQSLVDEHQKRTEAESEERARKKAKKSSKRKGSRSPSPPPPAFWDREKMMGSGGRLMDERQRKDLIGGSSVNLVSKFGGGKYL